MSHASRLAQRIPAIVAWGLLAAGFVDQSLGQAPAATGQTAGNINLVVNQPIELLPLVNLSRDRVVGQWSWQDKVLSVAKSGEPVILLPCPMPQEYVLEVVASRGPADGPSPALVIGLVVGDHLATVVIDAEQRSALWPVDGRSWENNPTTTQPGAQFQDDKPATVRCTVRDAHVLIEFDGRTLIDFSGDFSRLAPGWEAPRRDRCFLGSLAGHAFQRVTMTPLVALKPAARPVEATNQDDSKSDAKATLPDDQATEAARAKIRQSLRSEYIAAQTPSQQMALAEKLLQMSRSSTDEVQRLACAFEAQQKTLEAGRVGPAIEILDGIAADFGVDRLPLTVSFLETLAAEPSSYIYGREIIRIVVPRVREGLLSGRVDLAQQLAEQALLTAKRVNDRTLTTQFGEQIENLTAIAAAKKQAAASRKLLKTKPDDPAANLEYGRFLCLFAGDWKPGLAYLARGKAEPLATAAHDDLATTEDPVSRAETGNRWWQLAQQETGLAARQLQGRAGYWYKLAVPELTGLSRAMAEKRLTEVPEDLPFLQLDDASMHSAAERFLSDLIPTEVQVLESCSLLAKPLVVGELEVPNSLFMHPINQQSAHLTYVLPGGHRYLVGKVGLNGSIAPSPGQSNSPLTFRVVGDGHLLWQSKPLQIRGDSQKLSLRLGRSEKLELFVDCPGDIGYAHGIWANCVLTNAAKSTSPDPPGSSVAQTDPPKLELLEAKWGGGEHWADLTEPFKKIARPTDLVATSDLSKLSDPTPGWRKSLVLRFRAGEEKGERWFGENDFVALGSLPALKKKDRRRGLILTHAAYGGGYVWVDVTKELQSRITGSQLKVQVLGDKLGLTEDPLVGVRKTLYLQYWFNNQPHLAVLHDGDQTVIGLDQ